MQSRRSGKAYEIQMAAIVPAIRMQMRGVLPDLAAHSELLAGLKAVLPKFEEAYLAACDEIGRPDLRERGVPNTPTKAEALLEEILSDRDYENWERTANGTCRRARITSPWPRPTTRRSRH